MNVVAHAQSWALRLVLLLLGVASALWFAQCQSPRQLTRASQAHHRQDLIGGVRALGDLGDFILENDQIRVVIQGPGYSRGFGVYGGSIIDADIQRPRRNATSAGNQGRDAFGEMFPSFFLQATAVDNVYVDSDGGGGRPARVIAEGGAGDFLELIGLLNRLALDSHLQPGDAASEQRLRYRTIYELAPNSRHLDITFEVQNISSQPLDFPAATVSTLLDFLGVRVDNFQLPVGEVLLFGGACDVFMPGTGFDVRFGIEENGRERPVEFPTFPGYLTQFVAGRAHDVSYGFFVPESSGNYVAQRGDDFRSAWGDEAVDSNSSLLVPFTASGFLGIFHETAPDRLAPNETFRARKYFVVGSGDIGSVLDEMHRVRGTSTGQLRARLIDSQSREAAEDAWVGVYRREPDGARSIVSQYDLRHDGWYGGTLPPGSYSLRATGVGRYATDFIDFEINADRVTSLVTAIDPPARLIVRLRDIEGAPLPGKSSVVGTYGSEFSGQLPRSFLYDLQLGESWRTTDMVPDDPDDEMTRRFIEEVSFHDVRGRTEILVRPGTYEIVSSRGPEYNLARTTVSVEAGRTVEVAHVIERVLDTSGWIAGDMHLHSVNSLDSGFPLSGRVAQIAAEGVEWAVSSDHNYTTDLEPLVGRLGLTDFVHTVVGLELTTLEAGHFNGYPIRYEIGSVTHGSFAWAQEPPERLFAGLRDLALYSPEEMVVQVNHPRDSIMGYFSQHGRRAIDFEVAPPSETDRLLAGLFEGASFAPNGPAFRDENGDSVFSMNFDIVEVLNGKRFDLIHHYRVPETLPTLGMRPDTIPPAGTIVLDNEAPGGPDVAFGGSVDDWYNLLNLGYRYPSVGNSDSHSGVEEAGYFRTMIRVNEDRPGRVDDREVIASLRAGRAISTNGPMVEFWIDDATQGAIGSEITTSSDRVNVHIQVAAAPWVRIERINVVRNGLIVRRVDVPLERDLSTLPIDTEFEVELATDAGGRPIDSWFVVEVVGNQSFFPVVMPIEIPQLSLTDAVGSIAEPLGLGSDSFGILRPTDVRPSSAYALTNPVWVRTSSEREFQAPGIPSLELQNDPSNDPGLDNTYPALVDERLRQSMALTRGRVNSDVHRPEVEHTRAPRRRDRHSHVSGVYGGPHPLMETLPMSRYDIRRLIQAFNHHHGGP